MSRAKIEVTPFSAAHPRSSSSSYHTIISHCHAYQQLDLRSVIDRVIPVCGKKRSKSTMQDNDKLRFPREIRKVICETVAHQHHSVSAETCFTGPSSFPLLYNWNLGLGDLDQLVIAHWDSFISLPKTTKSEKKWKKGPLERKRPRKKKGEFLRRGLAASYSYASSPARYSGLSPIKSNDPEIASRAIINSNSRKVHNVPATSGTDNISRRNKRMH